MVGAVPMYVFLIFKTLHVFKHAGPSSREDIKQLQEHIRCNHHKLRLGQMLIMILLQRLLVESKTGERQKPPKCPRMGDWLSKLQHSHTIEYCAAIKIEIISIGPNLFIVYLFIEPNAKIVHICLRVFF